MYVEKNTNIFILVAFSEIGMEDIIKRVHRLFNLVHTCSYKIKNS